MFTGIISELGTVVSATRERGGLRVKIEAPATARGLAIGGSVAVDGVCLTAVRIDRKGFTVQVVPETMQRSTMSSDRLAGGSTRVNLERPLVAGGEIGGHFVQGHVDARARVGPGAWRWTQQATRRMPRVRMSRSLCGSHLWTAEEVERLSPNERRDLLNARVIADLSQLPADVLERVRTKGRELMDRVQDAHPRT